MIETSMEGQEPADSYFQEEGDESEEDEEDEDDDEDEISAFELNDFGAESGRFRAANVNFVNNTKSESDSSTKLNDTVTRFVM